MAVTGTTASPCSSSVRWTYGCYGLSLSADREIRGLATIATGAQPDVEIRFDRLPPSPTESVWYETPAKNRDGHPNLAIMRAAATGAFHFVYDDGTEFWIDARGSRICCSTPEGATDEDVAVYLRGPVLGLALRLRGLLCLHASAVSTPHGAIAFLGEAGSGKSATAAACVALGCRLLSDDVAVVDIDAGDDGNTAGHARFSVRPGYPRLNVWPDVAAALFPDTAPLPRVVPLGGLDDRWDKRYVALEPGRQFESRARPLIAIYVLGERDSAAAVRVERLSARDAFMAVANQTYVNYALDASMRVGEFKALGAVARHLPIRRVTPQNDVMQLTSLAHAILRDAGRLPGR